MSSDWVEMNLEAPPGTQFNVQHAKTVESVFPLPVLILNRDLIVC